MHVCNLNNVFDATVNKLKLQAWVFRFNVICKIKCTHNLMLAEAPADPYKKFISILGDMIITMLCVRTSGSCDHHCILYKILNMWLLSIWMCIVSVRCPSIGSWPCESKYLNIVKEKSISSGHIWAHIYSGSGYKHLIIYF